MSAAQVQAYYEAGGDLRRARGVHRRELPELYSSTLAPKRATERASVPGMLTDSDVKALRKWRRNSAPAWLPRSDAVMGDDTAAILAGIGIKPKNWRDVIIERVAGTGTFQVTVVPRRGYARTVLLPDEQAVRELGELLNQYSRPGMANSKKELDRLNREWLNAKGQPPKMNISVSGS